MLLRSARITMEHAGCDGKSMPVAGLTVSSLICYSRKRCIRIHPVRRSALSSKAAMQEPPEMQPGKAADTIRT